MPDIRCSHCGKENPDFLDVCQFCQSPLKPESMMHIGDKPTKKNTGELENVLPDWLKDVRQQARDLAEEDAAQAASMPKIQKEEPPDLLAGLAFQSANADEEEVPDWLSSLSSTTKKEKSIPPTPAAPETDFFAQFNKSEPAPKSEPTQQEEVPAWMNNISAQPPESQKPAERDELSEWFTQAAEEPVEPLSIEPDTSQIDSGWGVNANLPLTPSQPAHKEEEDLSWLHNLEAESKRTGELSTPKQESDWFAEFGEPAAPAQSSGQEDLSWLNNLGSPPAAEEPAKQPAEPKEDLSWLNDLGGLPASEQPAQQPLESKEDLSWLNNLGGTPIPEQPVESPSQPQEDLSWLNAFAEDSKPSQPTPSSPASQDDLSWLNEFGASQPSQPFEQAQSTPGSEPSSQDDLSWLNSLQGSSESLSAAPFADLSPERDESKVPEEPEDIPHVAPFTPRRTAPLNEQQDTSIPDWLKSATEEPSMPLGAEALDQFREDFHIPSGPEEPFSWKDFVSEGKSHEPPLTKPEPAFVDPNLFVPSTDPSTLSNQEVDSLFSVNMPDWLSQAEAEKTEEKPAQDIGIHAEGGEALAPVDLPSWVQAMRPVEAVISETAAVEDQPAEREGPLAGFRGVIPSAPIGSSRRPQPVPLKLQASDEQQASAAIMEQILASETSPRALLSASTFTSQRMLRQAIAALVWVVLSAVIFMRTQMMPVSASLPPEARDVTNVVTGIAENSQVLVVVDYQPSLAGEMEAVSGPLLDQLVLMRHPTLSFIATSPSSLGLVERLLANTNISKPEGLGYLAGENYFNLGYLPGGESGVAAFMQSPQSALPSATVPGFSGYSAIIMLTDNADSARVWVEQLQTLKQADPTLANQPLLVASSAQAGPMLQPYVSSRQISGLINGISAAAPFEFVNNSRPGIARSYWDAFGIGTMMAVALIMIGGGWSLVTGMRARRAEAGEG